MFVIPFERNTTFLLPPSRFQPQTLGLAPGVRERRKREQSHPPPPKAKPPKVRRIALLLISLRPLWLRPKKAFSSSSFSLWKGNFCSRRAETRSPTGSNPIKERTKYSKARHGHCPNRRTTRYTYVRPPDEVLGPYGRPPINSSGGTKSLRYNFQLHCAGLTFPYTTYRVCTDCLSHFPAGVLISITCKAWAKNIKHEVMDRVGTVHFELMID